MPPRVIYINGAPVVLNCVFYNVVVFRYLIIQFKCSLVVTKEEVLSCTEEMLAYTEALNNTLDSRFQSKTIGLILGEESEDTVYSDLVKPTGPVYYAGFTL